jgi:hypothetical protein
MSTYVKVIDFSVNAMLVIKETFALDYDMIDFNKEFIYSIGTTDVRKDHCKHNIIGFIKTLKKDLLNRRQVSEVIISNELEYVKFNYPMLNFTLYNNKEYYIEISSKSVELGFIKSGTLT